jgi:hypothetical protein
MRVTERGLTTPACTLDWMREIIIGSFQVLKGLTVQHWATTRENLFLAELDYMRGLSAQYAVFEKAECMRV